MSKSRVTVLADTFVASAMDLILTRFLSRSIIYRSAVKYIVDKREAREERENLNLLIMVILNTLGMITVGRGSLKGRISLDKYPNIVIMKNFLI